MLDERDEYLISRYPEGDLSPGERAHVEALLAESTDARDLLREYRQLSGLLRLSRENPPVDFASMRRAVSAGIDRRQVADLDHIDEQTTPAEREGLDEALAPFGQGNSPRARRPGATTRDRADSSRTSPWGSGSWWMTGSSRLAVAASLVLAAGLGWQIYRASNVSPAPGGLFSPATASQSPGRIDISAPASPTAQSSAITVIIGPSPAIAAKHPTILQSADERDSRYGTVELLPDSSPATTTPDSPTPSPGAQPGDRSPF